MKFTSRLRFREIREPRKLKRGGIQVELWEMEEEKEIKKKKLSV